MRNTCFQLHTSGVRKSRKVLAAGAFFGDNHRLNFGRALEPTSDASNTYARVKAVQLGLERLLEWNNYKCVTIMLRR